MNPILDTLEFAIRREIVIRAPRALVFRTFTDSERWARWWGAGSTIDGTAGGALRIVYPGGTTASGEVLELRAPERIVFSYGYEGGKNGISPGGSRVTITLEEHPQGTRLRFLHEVAAAATRDAHVPGWAYQLALFANVVANEAHAGAAALADRWFAAWNEPEPEARRAAFAAVATPDVVYHDAYACASGLDDLAAHVAATKTHMPGIALERAGEPRHCQGTAVVDWLAKSPDGRTLAKGSNVFDFAADGRIARAVGLSLA